MDPSENEPHKPENLVGPQQQAVDDLFSMYLEGSDDENNKITEQWKKECDAILIFTGLFSAALAALLAVSVSDIRPNPQDTSAAYVTNIYQILANFTTNHTVIPPSPPAAFSPPRHAVWVNALWFLSLSISLTGALLAVFIQQWAQSYIRTTQQRQLLQERVKTHEFCARGLRKSNISLIVRTVPTLIHISLSLFFTGLLIWLINTHNAVYLPTASWLGLCACGYAYVTVMPILHLDSPYTSPLSSSIRYYKIIMQLLFFQLLEVFPSHPLCHWLPTGSSRGPIRSYLSQLSVGMHQARLTAAHALSRNVNYDALSWIFVYLTRDSELERFYDAIPDLCVSHTDSLQRFILPNREKLSTGLVGLMDRTFSSNLVSESVKQQRIKICMRAAGATNEALLGHWYFLRRVFLEKWPGFLESVPFGLFVQDWQSTADDTMNLCIRCVVSAIVARVPPRDGDRTWTQLVRGHLSISDHPLADNLESTPQDNLVRRRILLLANLNCIISHIAQFDPKAVSQKAYDIVVESLNVLEHICKFEVQGTSPELQRKFCRLWNELFHKRPDPNAAEPPTRDLTVITLDHICKVHNALHGRTGIAPHAACVEDGPHSSQPAPTSPTNNADSGPAGNTSNPTLSHVLHDRTQAIASPSLSTLASSHGIPIVPAPNITSNLPVPSTSNTAGPLSGPVNEGTHAIASQSSSNVRDTSQTSPEPHGDPLSTA